MRKRLTNTPASGRARTWRTVAAGSSGNSPTHPRCWLPGTNRMSTKPLESRSAYLLSSRTCTKVGAPSQT